MIDTTKAPMLRATAERPHGVRRGCTCCSAPDRPARMRRAQRRADRAQVRAARYTTADQA